MDIWNGQREDFEGNSHTTQDLFVPFRLYSFFPLGMKMLEEEKKKKGETWQEVWTKTTQDAQTFFPPSFFFFL